MNSTPVSALFKEEVQSLWEASLGPLTPGGWALINKLRRWAVQQYEEGLGWLDQFTDHQLEQANQQLAAQGQLGRYVRFSPGQRARQGEIQVTQLLRRLLPHYADWPRPRLVNLLWQELEAQLAQDPYLTLLRRYRRANQRELARLSP